MMKWYPKVGDKFTISANKVTGDRSYTDKIWECKCVNVLCIAFDHPNHGITLLIKSEHDFAPMECPKELINEKWEPKKCYNGWAIPTDGSIYQLSDNYEAVRLYGNQFPTKELAETARDMNKRNQLILQAKHEMGYGDGAYGIGYFYDYVPQKWMPAVGSHRNPELTFETYEQVEHVIKMVGLNE